jgi:hypothetical protein
MKDALDVAFDSFKHSAVRLEALPSYDAAEEHEALVAYVVGQGIKPPVETEWSTFIRECRAAGKTIRRVRVANPATSAYVRYQCDVGYQPGLKAGEEIRLVTQSTGAKMRDFWLFDDKLLVTMHYTAEGRYTGSEATRSPGKVNEVLQFVNRLWKKGRPIPN